MKYIKFFFIFIGFYIVIIYERMKNSLVKKYYTIRKIPFYTYSGKFYEYYVRKDKK